MRDGWILLIGALAMLGLSAALVFGVSNFVSGVEERGYERGKQEVLAATSRAAAAAEKAARDKERSDRLEKEKRDEQAKRTLDSLRADNRRLRDAARARASYVPGPAPEAKRPDRAAFDRAELERALREFDEEVAGIVAEGDEARVKLDSLRD